MPEAPAIEQSELDLNQCHYKDDHISLPVEIFFKLSNSQRAKLKKHNCTARKLNRVKCKQTRLEIPIPSAPPEKDETLTLPTIKHRYVP